LIKQRNVASSYGIAHHRRWQICQGGELDKGTKQKCMPFCSEVEQLFLRRASEHGMGCTAWQRARGEAPCMHAESSTAF